MKKTIPLAAMICGLSLVLAASSESVVAQSRGGHRRGGRTTTAAPRTFGGQRSAVRGSSGIRQTSPRAGGFRGTSQIGSTRIGSTRGGTLSGFNGISRTARSPRSSIGSSYGRSGGAFSPRTANTTNGSIGRHYSRQVPTVGGSSSPIAAANNHPNPNLNHGRSAGYYTRPATSSWTTNRDARPSNRTSPYRSATRGGHSVGGRNLGAYGRPSQHHGDNRHDGRHSSRRAGFVPGFNVRSGYIRPNHCGTIVGSGIGSYGYGCRPTYGSYYYGPYGRSGYYSGGSYYGSPQWRYPIYSRGYISNDVYYGYDSTVYDGDVFEDLSTDVINDEAGEELEAAEAASEDRLRSAVQNRALQDFGERASEEDMEAAGLIQRPEEDENDATPYSGVTLEPGVAETARQIGIALGRGDKAFESRKYDQARAEYARALALAGEDSGSQLALGLAEFALGSFDDASAAIRRGVSRSPSLAMSDFDLRSAYGHSEDFEAHRRVLNDFVSRNPDDLNARFLLGFVSYLSGDRKHGIEVLNAYLEMPGHDNGVRAFINTARIAVHPSDR